MPMRAAERARLGRTHAGEFVFFIRETPVYENAKNQEKRIPAFPSEKLPDAEEIPERSDVSDPARPPSPRFTGRMGRVCARCARERSARFRRASARRSVQTIPTCTMARPSRRYDRTRRGEACHARRVASLSPRRDARDIESRARPRARKDNFQNNPAVAEISSRGSRPASLSSRGGSYEKTTGALERSSSPASDTLGSTPPIRELSRGIDVSSTPFASLAADRDGSLTRAQAHQHAG